MIPWLSLQNVRHRYGGVLALDGVSVEVGAGDFVAILGPNGAGKSTLGLILAGMLRASEGHLLVQGEPVRGRRDLIARGVSLVPEGRRLFKQMSIRENLLLGGVGAGFKRDHVLRKLSEVTDILPDNLRGDLDRMVGALSGGEQQMVAIGRAMMTQPKTLIVDEPSMGLAPVMINRIYAVLDLMHATGISIVLIEQVAAEAMKRAKRFYVMNRGRIDYTGYDRNDATRALAATLTKASASVL